MMETKWTPGPWKVLADYKDDTPKNEREWYIENAEDVYVASSFISLADADLAAAAPELYEALVAFACANLESVPPGQLYKAASALQDEARAALAKARGES